MKTLKLGTAHKPLGLGAPRAPRLHTAKPSSRSTLALASRFQVNFSEDGTPEKMVADTSDEEGMLPEDPTDLDQEIIYPQRPSIKELYNKTHRKEQPGTVEHPPPVQHPGPGTQAPDKETPPTADSYESHKLKENQQPQDQEGNWFNAGGDQAAAAGGAGGLQGETSNGEEAIPGSHEKPTPPAAGANSGNRMKGIKASEKKATKMDNVNPQAVKKRKPRKPAPVYEDVLPPSEERAAHELHRALDMEHEMESHLPKEKTDSHLPSSQHSSSNNHHMKVGEVFRGDEGGQVNASFLSQENGGENGGENGVSDALDSATATAATTPSGLTESKPSPGSSQKKEGMDQGKTWVFPAQEVTGDSDLMDTSYMSQEAGGGYLADAGDFSGLSSDLREVPGAHNTAAGFKDRLAETETDASNEEHLEGVEIEAPDLTRDAVWSDDVYPPAEPAVGEGGEHRLDDPAELDSDKTNYNGGGRGPADVENEEESWNAYADWGPDNFQGSVSQLEDQKEESVYSVDVDQAPGMSEFNFKVGDGKGNKNSSGYFSSSEDRSPGEPTSSIDTSLDQEESKEAAEHASRAILASMKAEVENKQASDKPVSALNKHIAAVRAAYDDHHKHTTTQLEKNARRITAVRVVEVAAGRAAAVGLASAIVSEVLYRQSVVSQVLGRWEGAQQVETAVPQAHSAAMAVLVGALVLTAAESFLARRPPPAVRWLGIPAFFQVWGGRGAMLMFTLLCVYETVHSNRPLFPFWYIFGL